MSTQNLCPECQKEMDWDSGEYICHSCKLHFKKFMYCPKCDSELEKLVACGAANYFCNSCNELVSRSKARVEFRQR